MSCSYRVEVNVFAGKMSKLIESFTLSKTGKNSHNEDAFVITDRFIAVFDGETNKSSVRHSKNVTPGRRAALALSDAVHSLYSHQSPTSVVDALHEAIKEARGTTGASGDGNMAAEGVVLDIESKRLIRVGYIHVGINGHFMPRRKLVDEVAGEARQLMISALLRLGATPDRLLELDQGRKLILPLLKTNQVWRNCADSPYGYPSLNGTATPAEMIEVIDVQDGAEVVIATDGYLDPHTTLAASEETLSETLAKDPLLIEHTASTKSIRPGNVSFDDRTYIRLALESQ